MGDVVLADVCDAIVDCEHKTAPVTTVGYPSIRTTNIKNGRLDLVNCNRVDQRTYEAWTQRRRPVPGDLILAREAPVGEVGIIPPGESVVLGQRTVLISPSRSKIDSRYLLFIMLGPQMRHRMTSKAGGSTVDHLNMRDIRALPLPELPPLFEQRAIAAVLGALDDKIELNQKQAQVLERIARAVFQSWFVDFDPVRRAAAGQPTGLPADLAALFPARLVKSAAAEIPEGWSVATLGDIATFNARTLSRADSLNDAEYIDYIEISEVMRGEVRNITRYTRGTEPSGAKRRLTHGDTVLSTVRPDRGAHFLCLNPAQTLIASTGFAVLSATERDWAFVYSAATAPQVGERLGGLADGGAYPAVRAELLASLPVILPTTLGPRLAYHHFAAPLFERASCGRLQSATLTTLRDTLLPKLISGELRIPDAEKIVGSAV